MLFAKTNKSLGLDVGSYSVKAVQLSKAGGRLRVEAVGSAPVDRMAANNDPVAAQAQAVREATRQIPLGQTLVVGALPGQTVVIRYPRLPDLSQEKLAEAVQNEAGQHIPYELSEVFLDWTSLGRIAEGEATNVKVLLVAAKQDVIERRVEIARAAELQFNILSVDSLALLDAAEACDFLRVGESVALVNFGSASTSIHFVKDGVSNFIRDVNWGARDMVVALSKARRCEYADAEALLMESAREPEAPVPIVEPKPAAPKSSGSLLDPLDEELGGLGDAGGGPARGEQAGPKGVRDTLSLPLARLVAEVRRSLDYYEQQLYERPVERILLSGGVAHLPFLGQTLATELGIEHVEVADPTSSALVIGDNRVREQLEEQPAQYMIAVGLAARGTIEL